MKSSFVAFAVSLAAAGVSANWLAEHGHRHTHQLRHDDAEKRDLPAAPSNSSDCEVVCKVIYTTIYGEPTLYFPPEPTTSTSSSVVVPSSSSTSSSIVIPVSETPIPLPGTSSAYAAPPSPSSSAVAASGTSGEGSTPGEAGPAPSSSSSSSSSSGASISSSGGGSNPIGQCSSSNFAMAYSPYNSDGTCRSASDVNSDLADIFAKGFCMVRLYSTDCNGLSTVGNAARNHGLQIILGVFIDSSGISGAQSQVNAIKNWAQWDLVTLIVVGNESIFNGYCTAADLAQFINSARGTWKSAGYNGWITTTEPMSTMETYASYLCPTIDIAGSNIHPFFNSAVDAGSAGSFVASQLEILDNLCPGLTGINLETGWPSSGECNGAACPSKSNQQSAVSNIAQNAGERSVILSYVNDYWKAPGAFDCEQSWGAGWLY